MGTSSDINESLTLEQLEGHPWGDPPADATRLIETVYELRHKPVGTMDTEDLRVLLLQQVSVDILVPVALTHLERNPLAEGDYYPGDLLVAVLKTPAAYWQQHPDHLRRVSALIAAVERLGDLDDHGAPHRVVWQGITAFRG